MPTLSLWGAILIWNFVTHSLLFLFLWGESRKTLLFSSFCFTGFYNFLSWVRILAPYSFQLLAGVLWVLTCSCHRHPFGTSPKVSFQLKSWRVNFVITSEVSGTPTIVAFYAIHPISWGTAPSSFLNTGFLRILQSRADSSWKEGDRFWISA
jgi:hypothetical protein